MIDPFLVNNSDDVTSCNNAAWKDGTNIAIISTSHGISHAQGRVIIVALDRLPGLILGLRPANERHCYKVTHWLGAHLESALCFSTMDARTKMNLVAVNKFEGVFMK